jgi:hypothetical protein
MITTAAQEDPVKTISHHRAPSLRIATLAAAAALAASACLGAPESDDAEMTASSSEALTASSSGAPTRSDQIVHVPFFIRDAGGAIPTDPSASLFEVRAGDPVTAPDGHQVTLAEFDAVQGTASVKCIEQGTLVTLHLTGLIPNGVYTAWNVVFQAPGFEPTFSNVIGLGALGTPDGSHNTFRASPTGQGSLSAITPPGPLSTVGEIGACALRDEFEWHVVGAYHIDGQTHGPVLGPAGSAVEQFGWMFRH